MFFEVFIVGMGVIAAVVDAPAFLSHICAAGHKQAQGEHILAFPALRRIEDLVHNVPLPEADYFPRFGEGLRLSGDADVSPHKCAQGISDVNGVQARPVRMRDVIFYLRMFHRDLRFYVFTSCFARNSAEDQPFEQ